MRVSKALTGGANMCHQSYGKIVALMQSLMGDFDLPEDTEQIQVRCQVESSKVQGQNKKDIR